MNLKNILSEFFKFYFFTFIRFIRISLIKHFLYKYLNINALYIYLILIIWRYWIEKEFLNIFTSFLTYLKCIISSQFLVVYIIWVYIIKCSLIYMRNVSMILKPLYSIHRECLKNNHMFKLLKILIIKHSNKKFDIFLICFYLFL